MNILVLAPYGMYQDFSCSFVHSQTKEFIRQGHRVRVVLPVALGKCLHDGKRFSALISSKEQDGVEICYVRHLSLGKYGAENFNRESTKLVLELFWKRLLKDFRPDIIHAHTIEYGGILGAVFKRKLRVPMVLTTHGSDTNDVLERGNIYRLKPWCDQAGALTACSERLAKNLALCGTEKPIRAIYNGFSIENITHIPKEKFHVVQVCSLSASKHVEYTVQAVARLKKHFPEITLTIVGDGPERKKLESLCQELELNQSVCFTGHLSNQDSMKEMAKAQIFVMPSYPEGLGIVYLEAMASGCVTIGTEGEGIDGIIVSGENGFLVTKDDVDGIVQVISRCFQDQNLLAQISKAGQNRAVAFTWKNNAKQYIDLFAQVIG